MLLVTASYVVMALGFIWLNSESIASLIFG